jgi:hypothetical protein
VLKKKPCNLTPLSQLNSLHIFIPYFSKIHFDTIQLEPRLRICGAIPSLPPHVCLAWSSPPFPSTSIKDYVSQQKSSSQVFWLKFCLHCSSPACVLHTYSMVLIALRILGEECKVCNFLHSLFILLGRNVLLRTLFANIVNECCSSWVSDEVTSPCKTTCFVCFNFIFSDWTQEDGNTLKCN